MSIRIPIRLAVLCGWALMLSSVWASTGGTEIPYQVRFRGVEPALRRDLESVSTLRALRNRPPVSMRQLELRAGRDRERFVTVLRSHGYYAASVEVRLRQNRRRTQVRFVVDTGPVYRFRTVRVDVRDAPPGESIHFVPAEATRLQPGEPAEARLVERAESRVTAWLGGKGYPFAQVVERDIRVEHRARAMDVTLYVEAGPQAVFGDTDLAGLKAVDEDFIRAKLPWAPGDPFDAAALQRGQRRLMAADLFNAVRIVRGTELDEDGALPLTVEVTERRPRSVTLGAGYRSDEGARGTVGWEHRNLRGRGERLTLSATLSEIGYVAQSRWRKPDVMRIDQNLTWQVRAALEEPDAYRSRHVGKLLRLDRPWRPGWLVSAGTGFKYASVREDDEEDRFGLLYFPVQLDADRSNDVLDPTRGWRLSLSGAPYRDFVDSEVVFFKSRGSLTGYVPLLKRPELTAAGRVVLGHIAGASRDAVPADERYYAGGGGSVRGYRYQSVGPLEEDDRPLGGKTLTLASAELRWRINQEFGLAAFLDGGTVFEESWPGSTDDLLWGAGAGVRYFTPFGPLRLDIAFPVSRRTGVDDAFQFYISLGQTY